MRQMNRHQDEIHIPINGRYVRIPANDLRSESMTKPKAPVFAIRYGIMKIKNNLQFILMVLSMIGMMSFIGYAIGGLMGVFVGFIASGLGFLFTSNYSIAQLLRKKNVQFVHPYEGGVIYDMISKLAEKAKLDKTPALFIDHSSEINAYTLEDKEKSAIVVSKGILNSLSKQELFGVLAHEIAHLKNNDIRIMLFSDQIRRLTGYMALFGQLLLVFTLPLFLANQMVIPWFSILLLMSAPMFSMLIQVAISRNREFRADMDAVELAGSAIGLSNALKKIKMQTAFWKNMYAPFIRNVPEILRTHPNTSARIKRLNDLKTQRDLEFGWSY